MVVVVSTKIVLHCLDQLRQKLLYQEHPRIPHLRDFRAARSPSQPGLAAVDQEIVVGFVVAAAIIIVHILLAGEIRATVVEAFGTRTSL